MGCYNSTGWVPGLVLGQAGGLAGHSVSLVGQFVPEGCYPLQSLPILPLVFEIESSLELFSKREEVVSKRISKALWWNDLRRAAILAGSY